MASGSKGEVLKSKVDPCAKCGKRVMENLAMCTKCGRFAKMKRVASTLEKGLVCKLCVDTMKGILEPMKKYHFLTTWSL